MELTFIIGTGRCGSTFVHEIIAKNKATGFVSNFDDRLKFIPWMTSLNNPLYRSYLGKFTKKGGIRFAPSEAYNLVSRQVSPIYANSSRDLLAEDVTPWLDAKFKAFFEAYSKMQNKPVFTHKYTGWSRVGFFSSIFPEAKFVHIVRDGRAVANSWLQMDWWGGYRGPENWLWGMLNDSYQDEWDNADRSYPLLAAISWKILMDAFHQAETLIPEQQYLKIRYEDILESPEEHFDNILNFCGMQWDKSFDKQFKQQRIMKNRSKAYLKDLSNRDLKMMENSLSTYLEMYDY